MDVRDVKLDMLEEINRVVTWYACRIFNVTAIHIGPFISAWSENLKEIPVDMPDGTVSRMSLASFAVMLDAWRKDHPEANLRNHIIDSLATCFAGEGKDRFCRLLEYGNENWERFERRGRRIEPVPYPDDAPGM